MDQFEKNELHLQEFQRKFVDVPAWAKAERLEYAVPQEVIWRRITRESIGERNGFANMMGKFFRNIQRKNGASELPLK